MRSTTSTISNSTSSMLVTLREKNQEVVAREESELLEPVFHYLEFQTLLMKILSKSKKDQSVKKNLNAIYRSGLFTKRQDGKWYAHIDWPHDNQVKTLTLCVYYTWDTNQYKLDFCYGGTHFLSMSNEGRDGLVIEKIKHLRQKTLLTQWEIENIIQLMKVFLAPKEVKYVADAMLRQPELSLTHSNHFNQTQFSRLIDHYGRYDFTYRIHGLLSHTVKRKNTYKFYLDWQGQHGTHAQLKVKFSFANPFTSSSKTTSGFSWVMPESTLLGFPPYESYNINTGQLYYKVEVFEEKPAQETTQTKSETQDKDSTNILNLWFTEEVGEIRDVCKGSANMPGNEVLRVFKYLDLLLRIRNIFICDESSLMGEDAEKVYLRLILPLVMGKTWYEKELPGLELLVRDNFVATNGLLSQSKQKRNRALADLQQLPLNSLYSALDEDDQKILLTICSQHLPEKVLCTRRSPRLQKLASLYEKNQFFSADATLGELMTVVYEDARSRHVITSNLSTLNALLCRGTAGINISEPLELEMSRKWVACRSEQLLSGSNFWVRKAERQSTENERMHTPRKLC